jgi:hypothetical protein
VCEGCSVGEGQERGGIGNVEAYVFDSIGAGVHDSMASTTFHLRFGEVGIVRY